MAPCPSSSTSVVAMAKGALALVLSKLRALPEWMRPVAPSSQVGWASRVVDLAVGNHRRSLLLPRPGPRARGRRRLCEQAPRVSGLASRAQQSGSVVHWSAVSNC
uniref:Predicted protein n=1 Tax=Hordeum vulgare subsp. vulgare TaxID=112509 RepID=F2EII0_HORVV|nr:predicted protein [Hordeum vulgare subsp. vulgare]BAK08107.1 predicted protein [Hordeum vulgare subsp. vulgare]